MVGKQKKPAKKSKRKNRPVPELHALYSAAVQSVDADFEFLERAFRKRRKRLPVSVREDFCGTAIFACEWARRRPGNHAWGVDLDPDTLNWGKREYYDRLPEEARARVHLLLDDVLKVKTPKLDAVVALNFSYFIFKERDVLRRYFTNVHRDLNREGVLLLDIFGGTGAPDVCKEERTIDDGLEPDGRKIPKFRFVWQHERYDAITHDILCHIHFKLWNGIRIRKAFTYDWRLWTIAELRELLGEAGFVRSDVYTHGWDEDGDSDGVYRLRKRLDNDDGWLGYIAAYK